MHQGKYTAKRPRKHRSRKPTLLLVCLLACLLTAGTTLAYLQMSTDPVQNTFLPGEVSVSITENKTATEKSNIKIVNSSGDHAVPVYVRATLVTYWQDTIDGTLQTVAPPAGATVSGGAVQSGWFEVDGIYYYTQKLDPGEETSVMLSQITVTVPFGSTAQCIIDVRAEAFQADPENAVAAAWPVKAANGQLAAK